MANKIAQFETNVPEKKLRQHLIQPYNRFHDMSKLNSYDIILKLGQGTFGMVQKARDIRTNRLVALKQLLNHSAREGFPLTAMREITILKRLRHEHILRNIDMVYEEPKVGSAQDLIHHRGCFYTVSPYMRSDLVGLLENPDVQFTVPHIKNLMSQLLEGINYIHEQMFLHRDVKAANILLDEKGTLKIADFGLARVYHGKKPIAGNGPGGGEVPYTSLVVTRWYRLPELLLGERRYTTSVDMWGVGCIFGELFTHTPILVGKSDLHQAQLIFSLCGAPTLDNWPQAFGLPNAAELGKGIHYERTLESRFSSLMTQDAIDLFSALLALNPYKRINAKDALSHPYFTNDPKPCERSQLPLLEAHEIDREKFKIEKDRRQASDTYTSQNLFGYKGPRNPKSFYNNNGSRYPIAGGLNNHRQYPYRHYDPRYDRYKSNPNGRASANNMKRQQLTWKSGDEVSRFNVEPQQRHHGKEKAIEGQINKDQAGASLFNNLRHKGINASNESESSPDSTKKVSHQSSLLPSPETYKKRRKE